MRCASSTCNAPSRVRARRPNISRIKPVRSMTLVFQAFSQIALLNRRDRAVHDHDRCRQAFCKSGNFVDFAFADIGRRPNFVECDQPRLDHGQVDGARKTDGLVEARFRRTLVGRRTYCTPLRAVS